MVDFCAKVQYAKVYMSNISCQQEGGSRLQLLTADMALQVPLACAQSALLMCDATTFQMSVGRAAAP